MKTFEVTYIEQKMDELNKKLYSLGCIREKRVDGFQSFPESSRKFRYDVNAASDNFYIEVVNKSDESFVAEIGNCLSYSIEEIVDMLKEY